MATPTTLIALLRAVHYGWRQEQIAESARQIAETGRELHRRLAIFVDPLAKLGRQLNSAVDAYNQAARSFDTRLAPKVREIAELGASSGREMPEPHADRGERAGADGQARAGAGRGRARRSGGEAPRSALATVGASGGSRLSGKPAL